MTDSVVLGTQPKKDREQALNNVEQYGFDMAFTAVLLVLLRGMWKGMRAGRPWLVSLAVAALTDLLVPGAWYVAAGAFSGLIAAVTWREQP